MKTYSYTAFEARGRRVRNTLVAASLGEALQRIAELGLHPLKVKELVSPAARGGSVSRRCATPRVRGVSAKALAAFTRQLATLVEAGLPLLRSLRLLEEQEERPRLKRLIRDLQTAIEAGATFTEAVAAHPRVFSRLYLNLVKAGEAGGVLDVTLRRLAEFLEKAQKIKGRVVAAMFYPAAVLVVASAVLSCLVVFLVPRFSAVFVDLLGTNHPMPPFTRFVLGLSETAASHFLVVLGGLAALGVGLGVGTRTRMGCRLYDRLRLRLPLFGSVIRKAAVARFARTLGTLLNSGVPILPALVIVREVAGNSVIAEAVQTIHTRVKEGESIASPMAASRAFPATVVGMVDVGEQTGALPDMLLKVADLYDDEVDNAIAAMTSLLEPLMIVALALIVGSIVVALFLPLIEIITDLSGPGAADG